MNDFIETLKVRQQEAQKRLQMAQQRLALAQAENNAATQEYNSWNFALAIEMQKVQREAVAAEAAKQVGPPAPARGLNNWPVTSTATATPTPAPEINKTGLVRDALRQNPAGMTPNEIWKQLKTQINDHAYIYSVLKRLRDRKEVTKKRGKYCLSHPQPADDAANNGVVQHH